MALTKVSYSMINGAPLNVLDYGADNTGVSDSTSAINEALTAAGAMTPTRGAVYIPSGKYITTDTLNIPLGVTLTGDAGSWVNSTGSRTSGTVIYSNHNSKAISLVSDGTGGNSAGGGILNLWIQCNYTMYPASIGVYVTGAQQVILQNIVVSKAATGFVLGDYNSGSPLFTSYITADNIYANGAYVVAFDICGNWHRLNRCIADAYSGIGFRFRQVGFSDISNFHTEGPTSGGILIGNGSTNNTFTGGYVNSDGAYGFRLLNDAGTSLNSFSDTYLVNGITGVGTGFDFLGGLVSINYINNCEINNFAIGVSDFGTSNIVSNNLIFGCALGISSDANDSKYTFNRFQATSGSYSISHGGGTTGIWEGNTLDKTINAGVTGVPGNFNGIKVRNNLGYVSRNSGVTTTTIISGTTISHGLAGLPSSYQLTPTVGGVTTQAYVSAVSSTTITASWAGTTNVQFAWSANLPCDP
jgi:hypothetical protein